MRENGIHLWLILWRTFQAVSTFAERDVTGSLGMCLSDFGVLEVLLHKGPLAVNKLGQVVKLTSGSITTAIDRLEQRQLVERRASPGDRRTRVVHLTTQGTALISSAFDRHASAMERAAGGLSPAERETLTELLKKFGFRAEELVKAGCQGAESCERPS